MTRFHLEHRIPSYYCPKCDTFHLGVDLGSCIGGIPSGNPLGFERPAPRSEEVPPGSGEASSEAPSGSRSAADDGSDGTRR